jgi:hypothetical protein
MKKFTFKTEKPVGKYSSVHPTIHIIKYDKKECGLIEHGKPFYIRLMVMKTEKITDNNSNCKWKWVTLKKESKTLYEAQNYLNEKIESIFANFTLNFLEP